MRIASQMRDPVVQIIDRNKKNIGAILRVYRSDDEENQCNGRGRPQSVVSMAIDLALLLGAIAFDVQADDQSVDVSIAPNQSLQTTGLSAVNACIRFLERKLKFAAHHWAEIRTHCGGSFVNDGGQIAQ